METKMTSEERQAFLAETRVGIISIPEEGRGPLTVPVWYNYQPGGELCVWTGANTRKGKLLLKAQRISFCVQDPTPPMYKTSLLRVPSAYGQWTWSGISTRWQSAIMVQ